MPESLTERGTFAIASHEAVVPCRYLDLANVPTIYIGHTNAAGPPYVGTVPMRMPRTREDLDARIKEAFEVFENDLKKYAAEVDREFGRMAKHERDGWVSWHFNTGGAFTSSAVGQWKRGDKKAAVATMMKWNKVKGVVSSALVKRRKEEANMILKGRYPKRDVAVWGTNDRGKVLWGSPIDLLDYDEVSRLAFDAPDSFFDRLMRLWRRVF